MNDAKNKSFFQEYIYGAGGKTILWVFIVGVALNIIVPSLVSVPMVFIALAIVLLIQRINKKRTSSSKNI